jgi:hypothetical protein
VQAAAGHRLSAESVLGYLCFLRVLSAASATSPTCSPIALIRLAAEVIESRSILLRSTFLSAFGIDGARSRFIGLFWLVRLLSATPPAIPASAAPAATSGVFDFEATATSGVFAFEATFETFSPACAIAPFVDEERPLAADAEGRLLDVEERPLPADDVVRGEVLAPPLFEPVRFVLDEALDLDVPFLLFDLPALDPVRLERVLEELVVCAILIASLLASMPAALIRTGGFFGLPVKARI